MCIRDRVHIEHGKKNTNVETKVVLATGNSERPEFIYKIIQYDNTYTKYCQKNKFIYKHGCIL